MKKLFTNKQIDNTSKFFWDIGKAAFAGGVITGIMMPAIQVWKVLLAFVASSWFALLGFLIDSISDDENPDKEPP
ncbi:hypothetical protein A2G06_17035 (plasmid) [Geobacter anodireducens]|nr:hypothetical protein A2G06_17035 [Geobacter anodireducens]